MRSLCCVVTDSFPLSSLATSISFFPFVSFVTQKQTTKFCDSLLSCLLSFSDFGFSCVSFSFKISNAMLSSLSLLLLLPLPLPLLLFSLCPLLWVNCLLILICCVCFVSLSLFLSFSRFVLIFRFHFSAASVRCFGLQYPSSLSSTSASSLVYLPFFLSLSLSFSHNPPIQTQAQIWGQLIKKMQPKGPYLVCLTLSSFSLSLCLTLHRLCVSLFLLVWLLSWVDN